MSFHRPFAHGGLALDKLRPCLFHSPSLLLPPTTTPSSSPPLSFHSLPSLSTNPSFCLPSLGVLGYYPRKIFYEPQMPAGQFWSSSGYSMACILHAFLSPE